MKIRQGIVLHNFGDSYVAYDVSKSLMHELNESAYYALEMISKKKNQDQMTREFAKHFDISTDQASLDLAHFVKTLESIEVIE